MNTSSPSGARRCLHLQAMGMQVFLVVHVALWHYSIPWQLPRVTSVIVVLPAVASIVFLVYYGVAVREYVSAGLSLEV